VSYAGSPVKQMEIVGVVRNTLSRDLRQVPQPTVYVPYSQQEASWATLEVHAAGSLNEVATGMRNVVRSRLPQASVQVQTLTAQVAAAMVQERLLATLASSFGVLALLLAVVGLYGLLAYTVTRRVSEIGIRMALGATMADVERLVMREGVRTTAIGLATGLALAVGVGKLVSGLLYQVNPFDPSVLAIAAAVLSTTAMLACYFPARRATRVVPLEALRSE
jgi:ABC-type antimicrobial peptide transport system permease subunit